MTRVALTIYPKKGGGFYARKRLPSDVLDEYQRLFGKGVEARFVLPAGTPLATARSRASEWHADVETRIANIRAVRKGEGQALSRLQARALAGEWYRWFVEQQETRPPAVELWGHYRDVIQSTLAGFSTDPSDPEWNPDDVWEHEPAAREAVRPMLADWGETTRFLTGRGLVLSLEAQAQFLDNLYGDFAAALKRLIRQAAGDYSPDPWPAQFPAFNDARDSGLGPWDLFERWVAAVQPAASTVDRWRAVFLDLKRHFANRTAASITAEEANEWAKALISAERSARTVADVWVIAARTVFAWAVRDKLITRDAFDDVSITVPKKRRLRETKAFTADEQALILNAALAITDTRRASAAAKRWCPWLCAYSGARVGEITQLRGVDIVQRDGVHAMRLTPEAGTVKTGDVRTVPLHEHLEAQGFLEFVKARGKGPLFYTPPKKEEDAERDPTNPRRPRATKARERLGAWVREIGVNDPEVRPNHAWRHTFKQIAERIGIPERIHDQITGHASKNVSREYGKATLADLSAALKRFPRYPLKPESKGRT